jgi:hypothetical protein
MESIPRDQFLQNYPASETLYGVRLSDLLARCRSMAHKFYRKHGRWEPYEEYLSAGQLAIAECLTRYDPAQAPPGGFLSYCCFQMDMKMRDVRIKAAGPYNMRKPVKGERRDPKYTVEGWDHAQLYALRSEQARQETTVYLHEVLTYLEPQRKAADMLFALVDGEEQPAIAERYRCSVINVTKHLGKLRRRLRSWASWSAA